VESSASKGNKIVDIKESNIHIVSYSIPINIYIDYNELIQYIYTLKDSPDAIPYRTSYYNREWGFCMKYNEFLKLNKNETYHVVVDSELKKVH